MAAWKAHIIQFHHAKPAVLTTGRFLAAMLTRAVKALTRLRTRKDLMHALRMAPRHTAMAASRKALVAHKLASSFRTESRKVFWLADLDLDVGVARAAEA